MDVNNEFVTSVKKENNLGFYRIHTIWKDDSFKINIASKDAAWSGEMTPDNAKEFSSQLQLDSQTYIKNCKDALTELDEKPDMKFMVEDGSFVWKKLVDEDSGISVKLGAVKVVPANFVEVIQKIVDVALISNKNVQGKMSSLNSEKETLVSKNNELYSALESAQTKLSNIESDLLGRFVEVLNSKKRKILELQNELEKKLRNKDDDDVQEVAVVRTTKQTKVTKAPIKPPAKEPAKAPTRRTRSSKKTSDSEAYEMDTDNDSDSEAVEKKKRRSSRLSAKNSQDISSGPSSSNSQKNIVPEIISIVNECPVEDNTKTDGNDTDSTISDESLANYANCNISEKNKNGEKMEESNKRPSPQKYSQATNNELLEMLFP